MVIEVRDLVLGVLFVRGILHGAEVRYQFALGKNDHAAGVLAGGPFHAHQLEDDVFLHGGGHLKPGLVQVFHDEAVGRLALQGRDGAGAVDVLDAEKPFRVAVSLALVFTREVKVDIRRLVALVAHEGLEGNVEAEASHSFPAGRAFPVGQVDPDSLSYAVQGRRPGFALVVVAHEFRLVAFRADVVGRQAVHFRDAAQKRHEARTHAASGSHDITVGQRFLHQHLGQHVKVGVMVLDDGADLALQPHQRDLVRILSVDRVQLTVAEVA